MTIPQAIEDAIRAHDWWGVEYGIREFFEQDKRDGTIEELRRELQAEKAKYADLEGRFYDLQGSVNLGIPHMNKRGSGAHYVIKRLTFAHQVCLQVLWSKDAFDLEHGLTAKEVALFSPQWGMKVDPYDHDLAHSLGGRLSEMQNPRVGLTTSAYNQVKAKDPDNGQFRSEENRWWIPSNLRTCQLEELLHWSADKESVPVPMGGP
ncbi:MAG: hypothetical protein KGI26_04810 [Thaumarchaeota archaeon]|nr:hypothetical protein [Nitrososphaerota archaeon]